MGIAGGPRAERRPTHREQAKAEKIVREAAAAGAQVILLQVQGKRLQADRAAPTDWVGRSELAS